jgi:hypothetical protein
MSLSTPPTPQVQSWPHLFGQRWRAFRNHCGTTPGQLHLALGTVCGLSVLFCLAVLLAVLQRHYGMQTVVKDSVPSIQAAQEIKANLADMHSNAANILLGNAQAAKDYEKKRLQTTNYLVTAARNITFAGEEEQIRQLLNELGRYEEAIAKARILYDRQEKDALDQHRAADRILHGSLLPAADALDQINREPLDEAYAQHRTTSGWTLAAVIVTGLLLVAALAATQVFLFRRMHRVLNPGLLAATVLTLAFFLYSVAALLIASSCLKLVKEDAFDSIHALELARAYAYDANGDESRSLLDDQEAPKYDEAFHKKSARILTLPSGFTYAKLLEYVGKQKSLPPSTQGYLADELNNITFAGEKDAALRAVRTWIQYAEIDARIRQLKQEKKEKEAIALCLGNREGESNWAFAQFDKALDDAIKINQNEMDAAKQRGFAVLELILWLSPAAALGVALLALIGLRPRMKEYSF